MPPGPQGQRARVIAGRVLLVIGALLLVEGVSALVLWLRPLPGSADEWVLLAGRPPPYADADYFSGDFVVEAMHSFRRGERPGAPADFEGEHIRVRDGLRQTTDQPREFASRILVFGASTVFSRRVPDALTIPSQLQRLANGRPGPGIQVVNLGHPGYLAAQQLERLRGSELRAGDRVVFYDGIAEIMVRLYMHRHPGRPGPRGPAGAIHALNPAQRFLQDLRVRAGAKSAAVRLAFGLQRAEAPGPVEDERVLRRVLEAARASFRDALLGAHRLAQSRGARFYHFLQPNLYLQRRHSDYERRLLQNELERLPGFDVAFRVGYPMLREVHEELRAAGVASFDISDAFDDRPAGQEIYFDTAHVNHAANAVIAERIHREIFAGEAERP